MRWASKSILPQVPGAPVDMALAQVRRHWQIPVFDSVQNDMKPLASNNILPQVPGAPLDMALAQVSRQLVVRAGGNCYQRLLPVF
jgi:hypothetical protein